MLRRDFEYCSAEEANKVLPGGAILALCSLPGLLQLRVAAAPQTYRACRLFLMGVRQVILDTDGKHMYYFKAKDLLCLN